MVTVETIKVALGIPPDDVSKDDLIQQSIDMAYALVWGYVGYDMSDTATEQEYEYSADRYADRMYSSWSNRNFVHLPIWPVNEVTEVLDSAGVPIAPDQYRVVKKQGRVEFLNGLPGSDFLTFHYLVGFDPMAPDVDMVVQNLATSIYNNGGTLQTAANPLKSLTMFDAMSMSFDTSTGGTGAAAEMLGSWSFILDKYKINKGPVLK